MLTSTPNSPPELVTPRPTGLRERRRERRRLADADRRAAFRAELFLLHRLLVEAGDLVERGWAQNCWFVVADESGAGRRIDSENLDQFEGGPVADVCLVGAIVQAGGGVDQAGSQSVHRALDLTWATLRNEPVRWCPSPSTRLAHVHDLTRWNDHSSRRAEDVSGLLALSADRADRAVRSVH